MILSLLVGILIALLPIAAALPWLAAWGRDELKALLRRPAYWLGGVAGLFALRFGDRHQDARLGDA